jgi:hypothetical protein
MGCDIHTFLEYSSFKDTNGDDYWSCFGGQINLGRDYQMFGVLAGVRDDSRQLFSPRGLPEGKLSYQIDDYMRIRIADEGTEPTEGEVTLATAQSWGEEITELNGKPRWVSNPDLHNHSWLTLDEYRLALAYYRLGEKAHVVDDLDVDDPKDRQAIIQAVAALQGRGEMYAVEYGTMLAAMEHLEANGCKTRLVFCFDN